MNSNQESKSDGEKYKYWGFISYSHADEKWAKWLHNAIEAYRVPRTLVGRSLPGGKVPNTLKPVFRDRDELATSHNLIEAVRKALEESRSLIVICSPSSARSPYVNEEIRVFKELGRGDNIHCVIVGGEPKEGKLDCFPPELRKGKGKNGQEPVEPIAADIRPHLDGKTNSLLKLIAGILKISFDELKRRHQIKLWKSRFVKIIASVVLIHLLIAGLIGLADFGVDFPVAEKIRLQLDKSGWTLFRPVHKQETVLSAANSYQVQLIQELLTRSDDMGQYHYSPAREGNVDAWSSAQVLASFTNGNLINSENWSRSHATIKSLFAPPAFTAFDKENAGWMHRIGRASNGNVALWVVAGLAQILDSQILPEQERENIMAYYVEAVQISKLLSPLGDGGWNMYAGQDDLTHHNAYTTALALLALLEVYEAELPWGEEESAFRTLSLSANWLIESYNYSEDVSGWKRFPGDTDSTLDGLSLQIYSLLLRAEEIGAITLPQRLVENMTFHLISLVEYEIDYPVASAEFTSYINGIEENESVHLLWYPWAIGATEMWLRRSERLGAAPENIRRVKRSLGHLVVDLGDDFVVKYMDEHTFKGAELLWNLADLKKRNQRDYP